MISRRQFHRVSLAAAAAAAVPDASRAQSPPAPGAPPAMAQRPEFRGTLKPELHGTHGMVAAGRQFTVEAGIRLLKAEVTQRSKDSIRCLITDSPYDHARKHTHVG